MTVPNPSLPAGKLPASLLAELLPTLPTADPALLLGPAVGEDAAIIDFARNVAGLENANTTEINPQTPYPVIGLITEWMGEDGSVQQRDEDSDLGGTMRMGAQEGRLSCDSLSYRIYGHADVRERHRHRYEVNNNFVPQLEAAGLGIAGKSKDGSLVEVIEVKDHPWFVACQFHPEFTSTPRDGHPLFTSFITAARDQSVYKGAKDS